MRKNVIRGFKMLDAAPMDTDAVSTIVNVINLDKASIFVEWAGSGLNGTITVEARNSEKGSWFELDFGVLVEVTTDSGEHILVFNELPHDAIRLTYNANGGSGEISAVLAAKQVGG